MVVSFLYATVDAFTQPATQWKDRFRGRGPCPGFCLLIGCCLAMVLVVGVFVATVVLAIDSIEVG